MDTDGSAPAEGADQDQGGEVAVEPARKRLSWPARIALGLALLLAAGVIAGFAIHVPYTTIAPGEAKALPPLITVEGGKSYPSPRGDIRLLFVREAYHVNLWRYLQARLDPDIDLVKDTAINPGELTQAQLNELALQQMDDAKNAAIKVALTAAGRKVGVQPGLTVSDLSTDLPAIKTLHWGDVILSADGHTVRNAEELSAAIAKHHPGQTVTLAVLRAGKRVTERVGVVSRNGRNVIGVVVLPRFSFPVTVKVDTSDNGGPIGGPSAGLAMTLAIFDDLTAGDLTGGHRVAVTGTIDAAGNVGEIGGIQQKAVTARAAHVSLFIVPQCSPDDPEPYLTRCKADLARAVERAGSKIKVVPVSTFKEALDALREAGGVPVTPSVPTTTTTTAA